MKVTEASESDIRELVERLNKKRAERKAQKEMEEVVRMVQKIPFVEEDKKNKKIVDEYFFNGLKLVGFTYIAAFFWNITGFKTFLLFVAVMLSMSTIDFYNALYGIR